MFNKPPGLPHLVVLSATAAVILMWASYPYWYGIEMFFYAVPFGGLLLAYWAIRVVLARRAGTLTGSRLRWILPPFIAGGVVLALMTDAPFWIRFTISAPSMQAYAKAVAESPGHREPCQWVGLYYVCDGWRYLDLDTGEEVTGSAEFGVEDWFLHGGKGFVWLPSGKPYETVDDRYRYLKDHWYGSDGWGHW